MPNDAPPHGGKEHNASSEQEHPKQGRSPTARSRRPSKEAKGVAPPSLQRGVPRQQRQAAPPEEGRCCHNEHAQQGGSDGALLRFPGFLHSWRSKRGACCVLIQSN